MDVQPVSLFDDNTTIVPVMTAVEAEASERRILALTNDLRAELLRFYEGRGWAALGYPSWRAWGAARLGQSEWMAYKELTAGQVEQILDHGPNEIGTIPERQLRPLAPLRNDPPALRETWERAHDIAEERGERFTARHVTAAVQERTTAPSDDDVYFDEPLTAYEEQLEAQRPPEPIIDPEPPRVTRFNEGLRSSETPEWYTPRHIIDKVIELFGHIDLDPCSNAHGDAANVPARYHFTAADDGLAQPWRVPAWVDDFGEEALAVRVYMNPPYGDEISAWVERLARAYESGEITEAIALLPARTDTAWFQPLFDYTACWVRGRLRFSGAENSAPFPSALIYLGEDIEGFREIFGSLGKVK